MSRGRRTTSRGWLLQPRFPKEPHHRRVVDDSLKANCRKQVTSSASESRGPKEGEGNQRRRSALQGFIHIRSWLVSPRGVGQERLGPSYFFISLVLGPLNCGEQHRRSHFSSSPSSHTVTHTILFPRVHRGQCVVVRLVDTGRGSSYLTAHVLHCGTTLLPPKRTALS